MNRRHLLVIALVAVIVVVLGSIFVFGSENTGTPDDDEISSNSNDEPSHMAEVRISPRLINESGEIISPRAVNESKESIRMRPRIVIDIFDYRNPPEYDNLTYEDVTLCMYDENGSVLHEEVLGTIETGTDAEFYADFQPNITVNTVPQFVIVDHPNLRGDSPIYQDIRIWDPEIDWAKGWLLEHGNLSDHQDDFEWPRTNETGTCG